MERLFQFTPLREGRRLDMEDGTWNDYFNSRPCERGDMEIILFGNVVNISIHAPARGATCCTISAAPARRISIHAPARGATPLWGGYGPQRYFNSRPCERGDSYFRKMALTSVRFQFTPLREGRLPIQFFVLPDADFNSRPCERGDAFRAVVLSAFCKFQFTPLREGRPDRKQCSSSRSFYFNSRPCERGDQGQERKGGGTIFQFTPLREGRHGIWRLFCWVDLISIHAPARGATGARNPVRAFRQYFNSRPCERGDCCGQLRTVNGGQFQFTPLREGRPECPHRFTR